MCLYAMPKIFQNMQLKYAEICKYMQKYTNRNMHKYAKENVHKKCKYMHKYAIKICTNMHVYA